MQYWLLSIAKQALQMKDLNSTEGWKFSWNDGKDEDLTQFTSRPPEQFDELVIAAVMMAIPFSLPVQCEGLQSGPFLWQIFLGLEFQVIRFIVYISGNIT